MKLKRVALVLPITAFTLYLLAYLVLVTPARFVQCLAAPIHYFDRTHSALPDTPLPAFTTQNTVQLLVNGHEILPAMLDIINRAETSIRWQVMLFKPDRIGQELAAALVAASERGVQVQLSFDYTNTVYGNLASPNPQAVSEQFRVAMLSMLREFEVARIVMLDNPPALDFPNAPPTPPFSDLRTSISRAGCVARNHYDHQKFLIVDGHTAIVGGANVGEEYLYHIAPDLTQLMREEVAFRSEQGLPEPWAKWQDVAVLVQGQAAQALARVFDTHWQLLGGMIVQDPDLPVHTDTGTALQVVSQRPDLAEIATTYRRLVEQAQESIFVASPYVTYPGIVNALREASRRGVQVTLVVPDEINDSVLASDIFRAYTGDLLADGVEIHLNNQRMAHGKVMVVDRRYTTIGSFNLNYRSFLHDDETNVVVDNAAFAEETIAQVFVPYFRQSERVVEPFDEDRSLLTWLLMPLT